MTRRRILDHKSGWLFIFGVIVLYFYRDHISYNEMDVVPYARSVFDENWLSNDWYLNLNIQYRFLFSYLLGWMVDAFGYNQTVIVGRLISYATSALAINYLIFSIKSDTDIFIYYLSIVLFFQFFGFGYGAGEWIVGGIETKVFSYTFALFSLALVARQRILLGAFSAGLSLSFHLLVGIYHIFCLIPLIFLFFSKEKVHFSAIAWASMLFVLGGFNGVIGIVGYLSELGSGSNDLGWLFYVNFRVTHHVLPTHHYYKVASWVIYSLLTLVNVIFLYGSKTKIVKQLSLYALFASIITFTGLIIFWVTGPSQLMRFYFFRYTDVMLPLMTLLGASILLTDWLETLASGKRKVTIMAMTVMTVLLLLRLSVFMQSSALDGDLLYDSHYDEEMETWVRRNTDPQMKGQ